MTPKNIKPNWRILTDFRAEHIGWLFVALLLVAILAQLSALKLRKVPTVPQHCGDRYVDPCEPVDLGLSTKAVQINPVTKEIELVEMSEL